MPLEGRPNLLDQYGRPILSKTEWPYDDMALPQVLTFTGLMGTAYHTYLQSRYDESRRISGDNAQVMLQDARLIALLQERQRSVRRLKWHLEVDDERDAVQVKVRDQLQQVLSGTPSLKRLIKSLLWAIWHGRYGVQLKWHWQIVGAVRSLCVAKHTPVNGDKIGHHFDGTPFVLVNMTEVDKIPKSQVIYTDVAPAVLLRGSWRDRFVIHKHDVVDADYFDIELAEQVHGVGVRHWLAWTHWLKREYLAWIVDYMERVGLGVTIYEYDASNPQSKAEAEKAAKEQNRRSVILWPRWPNSKMGGSVQRLETPVGGVDALLRMIEHIEEIEERLIVGQTASSRSDSSGLGTHDTGPQEATKADITEEDAENLEETLTGDDENPGLVSIAKRWTFPNADFPVRWKFDLDRPDPKETLEAVNTAYSMGVDFVKDEVRNLTGLSKPTPNDDVIGGQQAMGQGLPGEPGDAPLGEPGEGDDEEPGGDGPFGDQAGRPADQYGWDANQHPRGNQGNKGQFRRKGTGAGGDSGKAKDSPPGGKPDDPADDPYLKTAAGFHRLRMERVRQTLAGTPGLTDQQREQYASVLDHVVRTIPASALKRLDANERGITFHPDFKTLTAALAAKFPELLNAITATGDVVAGLYDPAAGHLYLDGGTDEHDAAGIYAHEFSHAIDGPRFELSKAAEWRDAWQSEIVAGTSRLSAYATTSGLEGFAEFGRLLYAHDMPLDEVEKRFPKCSAYWKRLGLWPT